jgi:hypothetical protein
MSLSTLKSISKDHEHNEQMGKEFGMPHKKRPRRKIETDVGDCCKCII